MIKVPCAWRQCSEPMQTFWKSGGNRYDGQFFCRFRAEEQVTASIVATVPGPVALTLAQRSTRSSLLESLSTSCR